MLHGNLDVQELVRRVLKYLLEGLAVAVAAFYLPGKKLDPVDIVSLALVAAATFALLDLLVPSVGASARSGAGLGIGLNMVGLKM